MDWSISPWVLPLHEMMGQGWTVEAFSFSLLACGLLPCCFPEGFKIRPFLFQVAFPWSF